MYIWLSKFSQPTTIKIIASILTKQPWIWKNIKVKIKNRWNAETFIYTGIIPLV